MYRLVSVPADVSGTCKFPIQTTTAFAPVLVLLQVTPALARKLLASNANRLAETLQRQQQRWQQQQPASQPPAAVLLQYCLSDVSNSTPSSNAGASAAGSDQHVSSSSSSSSDMSTELLGALRQLHGLPLLPAADGSLQTIKLRTLQQMHSNRQPVVSGSRDAGAVLYVPADPVEQQLLSQLPGQLLHPSVSVDLNQQLLQIAAAGVSNVGIITCRSLDQHILPQLLPAVWYGQLEVTWSAFSSSTSQDSALTTSTGEADPPDEAQQQQQQQQQQQREPSREFIQLLWQWIGQRGDAAELARWPVLPVAGGKLRLLQQPAQVSHRGCLVQKYLAAISYRGCVVQYFAGGWLHAVPAEAASAGEPAWLSSTADLVVMVCMCCRVLACGWLQAASAAAASPGETVGLEACTGLSLLRCGFSVSQ
jgi:hypothetical protein